MGTDATRGGGDEGDGHIFTGALGKYEDDGDGTTAGHTDGDAPGVEGGDGGDNDPDIKNIVNHYSPTSLQIFDCLETLSHSSNCDIYFDCNPTTSRTQEDLCSNETHLQE